MKTLYLDCGMGAAGDMLTAALLELLPDPDGFIDKLNALGIPGVEYKRETTEKCGIKGTCVRVTVHGEEESEHLHEHHHDRPHEHLHDHHHSGMDEIRHIVTRHLSLPPEVAADVMRVYDLLADAESRVHGVPVDEIHFHEVGTMDAVADITAVCLLMHALSPDEVIVSPVCTGGGTVACAHGILPVPAPATAFLLQGVPVYSGEIKSELCTPTGAALLKYYADRFGSMPTMTVEKIGYGMGKKDFPQANCVRAMLGKGADQTDAVSELACNLDDMTAEEIGFAAERLFEAGALEVFTTPAGMKKNRPGTLLTVLCAPQDRETIIQCIYKYTSTIGVRETEAKRYILDRNTSVVHTPYGDVRVKISAGYGVKREKYEYEDLARIAKENGLSLAEAKKEAEKYK